MIDPSWIATAIHPIQIQSPSDIALRKMQLGNASQEMQLRNQQMQMGGLDLQQKQMDLEDQQKMRQAWTDAKGDPEQTFALAVKYGTGPKSLMAMREGFMKLATDKAGLDEKTLANNASRNDQLHSLLSPVAAETDPVKQQARWNQQVMQAVNTGVLTPMQAAAEPYPGPERVQDALNALNTDKYMTAAAAQMRGQAAQREADIRQTEFNAKLPGIQAETAMKQRELAGQAPVQPFQQAQLDFQKQKEAREAKAQQQEIGVSQQRVGLERSRDKREQAIYDQTYGSGANPALVGVEPRLRTPAAAAAQKAADEHTKAQAAAADMESFISLARNGNKEAYAYMGPEGVLTLNTSRGVMRVNRQELDAYSGAGSLFDQLAGKMGKITRGQSIPPDLLNDMETLHNQINNNADGTYNSKLSSINQNYHSNFQPAPSRAPGVAAATVPPAVQSVLKSAGPGIHTLSDGSKWMKAADGSITKQ